MKSSGFEINQQTVEGSSGWKREGRLDEKKKKFVFTLARFIKNFFII